MPHSRVLSPLNIMHYAIFPRRSITYKLQKRAAQTAAERKVAQQDKDLEMVLSNLISAGVKGLEVASIENDDIVNQIATKKHFFSMLSVKNQG